MNWSWVCRECKKEYPESCEGLNVQTFPFMSHLSMTCTCGGMVSAQHSLHTTLGKLRPQMSNNSFIADLLLIDPDTHEPMKVHSDLAVNADNSYSFVCMNPKTGGLWKHTIKTEELDASEFKRFRSASRGAGKPARLRSI